MKAWYLIACLFSCVLAQRPLSGLQIGSDIPPEVQKMYEDGLNYLATSQNEQGAWDDSYGNQPGVVGMALLAFLASGEDPNYGPYRIVLQKGTEYLINQQNSATGYIGNSMYNHGFATLALAELYGHLLSEDIGPALQKAVDLILESQANNPQGAWRYTPVSNDADTTVSGAQVVALIAAKNAGLSIPDTALSRATAYYNSMITMDGGMSYSGTSGSGNSTRAAIASLAYSLQNDYQSSPSEKSFAYIRDRMDETSNSYPYYHFYYLAQALFQGDMDLWRGWNRKIVRVFEATQLEDGAWPGRRGSSFATSAALLSMALNYRLMPIYER